MLCFWCYGPLGGDGRRPHCAACGWVLVLSPEDAAQHARELFLQQQAAAARSIEERERRREDSQRKAQLLVKKLGYLDRGDLFRRLRGARGS